MKAPRPLALLILLSLLAGCTQQDAPQPTEPPTITTTPTPPDPWQELAPFRACHYTTPDKQPFPCGTTVAVQAEEEIPEGWTCLAMMESGQRRASLWSDRTTGIGLALDPGDTPILGVGIAETRTIQATGTPRPAYLSSPGFIRLPDPTTDGGTVEFRWWDFQPATPVPGFAVDAALFPNDPRFGADVAYGYRATLNGTTHHFPAAMAYTKHDDRTTWHPIGSIHNGTTFRFEFQPMSVLGLRALEFGADWDDPNPVLEALDPPCGQAPSLQGSAETQ